MKQMVCIIKWLIFSTLASVWPVTSQTTDAVKFVGLEFTGAVQADKRGGFDYMMQDVARAMSLELDYEVYVPARGLQRFLNHQADCLIPSSTNPLYFTNTPVLHSASFANSRFTAFSIKGPTVDKVSDLQGKIVGMIRDNNHWNYAGNMAEAKVELVGVNDLSTLVKMLYLGRIDVAVHERDDFLLQVQKLALALPQYSATTPLWTEQVVITCHPGASIRTFLDKFNHIVSDLNQSGKMDEYYQRVAKQTLSSLNPANHSGE